jgi:hypothetical protein
MNSHKYALTIAERDEPSLAHIALTRNDKLERTRLRAAKEGREMFHNCVEEIKTFTDGTYLNACPVCNTVLKTIMDFTSESRA